MDSITLAEAREQGKELFEYVEGDYSWDAFILFKVGSRYAYFTDGGCSCYGPWEEDDETSMLVSKADLKKLAKEWLGTGQFRDKSAEQYGADYIKEFIK